MSSPVLISCLQLVGGLAVLALAAEALVRGAVAMARMVGISSFVVGLTVVAFGTSAPELATGINDALREGGGAINVGNVVGSNIANIGLIVGAAALICPIPVRLAIVRAEIVVMLAATLIAWLVMADGAVDRTEGAVLLGLLGVYLVRGFVTGRRDAEGEAAAAEEIAAEFHATGRPTALRIAWDLVLIVVGLVGLTFGSDALVSGASEIALTVGVPEVVIAQTLVAFGTSVPELATSVVAALRRQPDIAIGNVLGSNVFNLLAVLGLPALIADVQVPARTLSVDLWVMLGFSAACLPIMATGHRVSRQEGLVLVIGYLSYVGVLFALR